ncbi:hypothetical protein ACFFQF_09775 [Haladaptatus pallidirubidus]|uniref:DUF8108 domain-containing protein n=1 Tax=Haladaptatus pallidirubidus TaxID=1008152 RepID=A0AAV3UFW1_9EURY|nr:hypothetical protein [Haladaptatus pallidirubidus]
MAGDAVNRLAKRMFVLAGILLGTAFLGIVVKSLISLKAILLLIAIFVPAFLLAYRLNKAHRAYDRGRYGIARRVVAERTTLSGDGCSVCDCAETRNQPGVRRRFVKELIVDGVPVALVASGQNNYCVACVETTSEVDSGEGDEVASQTHSKGREHD